MTQPSQARPPHGFEGDDDYDPGTDADVSDLLGAPAPSCTFPEIGAKSEGKILAIDRGTQRDPDGKERTWPDGRVKEQVILTIQTKETDDDDDDGVRRLFVKGTMAKPFREALKRAKVRTVARGGVVTVEYAGDGEKPKQKGMNPPKIYVVNYTPPA